MRRSTRGEHLSRSASAWRAQALVEVEDIRTQLGWMGAMPGSPQDQALAEAVKKQLDQALFVINTRGPTFSLLTGAQMQSARGYIDAATVNLLRVAPAQHLRSLLPNLLVEAQSHLRATDPRLQSLTDIYKRNNEKLTDDERFSVVATVQAAQLEAHREQTRLQSYRNVILGVATVIAVVAAIVAVVGIRNPTSFPLCFAPESNGTVVVVSMPAALRRNG
jgi:hypothetical protein